MTLLVFYLLVFAAVAVISGISAAGTTFVLMKRELAKSPEIEPEDMRDRSERTHTRTAINPPNAQ